MQSFLQLGLSGKSCKVSLETDKSGARLFKSQLTPTWDYNLTKVPVSLISKEFLRQIPSYCLKATNVKM